MKTILIYALCEPDLQVPIIRYIGKTVGLKRRLEAHFSGSVKLQTHLGRWLARLKSRGEKPVFMELCRVPEDISSRAEILFIRLALEGGMELTNATEGGEGNHNPSPEICKKISATRKSRVYLVSEANRKAQSERMTGDRHPYYGKLGAQHPAFGYRKSPEQREKESQRMMGAGNPQFGQVTVSSPTFGKKHRRSSSKFQGVSFHPKSGKWGARICMGRGGKTHWLGLFENEPDAAKAYDTAAKDAFGDKAVLNFP